MSDEAMSPVEREAMADAWANESVLGIRPGPALAFEAGWKAAIEWMLKSMFDDTHEVDVGDMGQLND